MLTFDCNSCKTQKSTVLQYTIPQQKNSTIQMGSGVVGGNCQNCGLFIISEGTTNSQVTT